MHLYHHAYHLPKEKPGRELWNQLCLGLSFRHEFIPDQNGSIELGFLEMKCSRRIWKTVRTRFQIEEPLALFKLIQIDDKIISQDLLEEHFLCDLKPAKAPAVSKENTVPLSKMKNFQFSKKPA